MTPNARLGVITQKRNGTPYLYVLFQILNIRITGSGSARHRGRPNDG